MTKKSLSIEDTYKQLKKIVSDFEGQDASLEKSIPQFKKGLKLASDLKKRLTKLRNQVEEIKDQFDS